MLTSTVQCAANPATGISLSAPHKVVVDVVGDLVDGAAHEVVGAKDAELVLDFVVVVTERCVRHASRAPIIASTPVLSFWLTKQLRRRFVDVHKLVRDQPPCRRSPPRPNPRSIHQFLPNNLM